MSSENAALRNQSYLRVARRTETRASDLVRRAFRKDFALFSPGAAPLRLDFSGKFGIQNP